MLRRVACLALIVILLPLPVGAQAEEVPEFFVGANKVYAHASADSMQVWMSTLEVDGENIYYLHGGGTTAQGYTVDPVANEAFTARIPLTPALAQDLVLDGTVTVQAYIGGGAYSGGFASIATSLHVNGAAVASAVAKNHPMNPQAPEVGGNYNPISWTMTVPATEVAAGSVIEWVISGTSTGNNIYLAANGARGRSYIELPVAEVVDPVSEGPVFLDPVQFPVALDQSFENATGTYQLNWTSPGGNASFAFAVEGNGSVNATVAVGNATVFAAAADQNGTLVLPAGNGTVVLNLTGFSGRVLLDIAPAVDGAPPGEPGTGTTQPTSGDPTGTETLDDDGKGAPVPLVVPLLAFGLAAMARRRW